MKYQLPTGKTISISFEKWLDLTDEDIQELIAKDAGRFVDDPFPEGKSNGDDFPDIGLPHYGSKKDYSEPEIEPLNPEIIEEIIKDIEDDK